MRKNIVSTAEIVTESLEAHIHGYSLFLASDFVNGQILYVDGGILAYIGKQP